MSGGELSSGAGAARPPAPRQAVALAIGATAVGPVSIWMLAAFAPVIQAELGFSSLLLGAVLSLYFGTAALVGVPMGLLVQRLQWERSIALVAVVAGLSVVGAGLLGSSLPLLAIFIIVGAIANSVALPASNLALEMNVRPGRRGVAYGLKQAAVPVSTMVVGLSVPVFAGGLRWREAFVTAGAVAVALFIAVALRRLRNPRRSAARSTLPAVAPVTLRIPADPARVRRVPASLLVLGFSAALGAAATTALGGFVVVYASDSGMSPSGGALLLAVASGVGIVSRIVTGILADRRQRRHLVVVAAMMGSGGVGAVLMALADGSKGLLIVGTLIAFALGWSWNGLFHLAVVRYSRLGAAVTTGVIQSAMSIGSMIGPLGFGIVAETSYSQAWLLLAALLSAAAGGVLLARVFLKREHGT